MPNGVVSAAPGTIYRDTAGTNGAWLWIKKVGTNNQGWVVLDGNTGRRNISALLPATLPNTNASWPTIMWRDGNKVTVAGNSAPTVTSAINALTVPLGFRQPASDWVGGATGLVLAGTVRGGLWMEANVLKFASTSTGAHHRWSISWDTFDPWPVGALPGNPV